MKLTKYQHACFTVEHAGKLLVVDPGVLTRDLGALDDVVAIVVTHQHTDHFDPNALQALLARNPDARIFAPSDVLSNLSTNLPAQSVAAGERLDVTPFTLEFYGGEHALIHASIPRIDNVGVMINDTIYYPGDSFVQPDRPIHILALPAAAPWMQIGQAIDFLQTVKPRFAFPTHDAIYSEDGKKIADTVLGSFAQQADITYQRLSQPLDTTRL